MAILFWTPCSEGTGTTVGDISGNGLDLTPGTMPSWAQDVRGWGLDFNGTTHYLKNSSWPSINPTSAITVSAWINAADSQPTAPAVAMIVAHSNGGASNDWSWAMGTSNSAWNGNTNKLGVILSADGTYGAGANKVYESATTILDSAWHHVAFTFASNTLVLYVDGNSQTPYQVYNDTVNSLKDCASDLVAGAFLSASSPANFFDGLVNDIQIWDAALSAAQITQVYRRRAAVYHWRRGRGDV